MKYIYNNCYYYNTTTNLYVEYTDNYKFINEVSNNVFISIKKNERHNRPILIS